jgi:hypothetical protein
MPDRKQTPDILGDLLGGHKDEDSKPSSQDTSKTVRQHTGKTSSQPTGKTASSEAATEEKRKATYYLSPEAIDALEEAWLSLRRMATTETRNSVSKSAIVDAAILLAVQDLQDKEDESELAAWLSGSLT